MNIQHSITALANEIATYRRAMHEHPQTAYEETFASDLVAEKLSAWEIPFERGLGKTGLVATITGAKNSSGKSVGLRADMDALDIMEENNKPHVSKIPGKMHGCGHDGHTAMLLGAAKYLNDTKNFDGRVHLIFQPAEEGAQGAQAMIADGLFDRFPCDEIYGLHNWPEMPRGHFGIRPGAIMASSDKFSILIHGKGGHAAMPHRTIDPVVIGAQIVTVLQSLISRTVDPIDTAVISITNFMAGTGAHNVIPDTAKLTGTLRSFSNQTREHLKTKIETLSRNIAESFGASISFDFTYVIDATINDERAASFCADIAASIAGENNINRNVDPCMGGEDFGAMLERVRGAYIWMGQGEPNTPDSPHNQGLHTPRYDFNDAVIAQGIEYWARIVEGALPIR
jgi:hippurate hydrolase